MGSQVLYLDDHSVTESADTFAEIVRPLSVHVVVCVPVRKLPRCLGSSQFLSNPRCPLTVEYQADVAGLIAI